MSLGEKISSASATTKLLLHLNGNSTDSSGNGEIMTNNNGVTFTNGKFGQGADFGTTNSNKSLTTTSLLGLTQAGDKTISLWVKLNTEITTDGEYYFLANWWGTVAGAYVGFTIAYRKNGANLEIRFRREATSGTEFVYTGALGTTNWHHVVLTFTGTTMAGYVDGSRVNSVTTGTGTGAATLNGFALGIFIDGVNYDLFGMLDEVIVENVAWTLQQVAKYYTMAKGRFGII